MIHFALIFSSSKKSMIKKFDDFSDDDLLFISNCKKLKHLNQRFNQNQIQSLINGSNVHIKKQGNYLKPKNDTFDQAFLSTGEVISSPVYVLYYLCGIFTGLTFSIICLVLIPIALVLSSVYFYSTYQEEEKNAKKQETKFQFVALKLSAVNEVVERLGKSSPNLPEQSIDLIIEKVDKNKLTRLRKSLSTTMGVSTALFGSYYSLAIVLAACGSSFAVGMLGPLAVGISIIACIGVGIYFGYKYYQSARNSELLGKSQKKMQDDLEEKTNEYTELAKRLKKKTRQRTYCTQEMNSRKETRGSLPKMRQPGKIIDYNQRGAYRLKGIFFKKIVPCSEDEYVQQDADPNKNIQY